MIIIERLLFPSPHQFCSNTQISNAPTWSFSIPGSPPPCAMKQKELPAPITGIRNHKNKTETPKHPLQPKRSKAESPSVVRWSAVTRRPEPQENNKQDTALPNVHQQTCAEFPSLMSNGNLVTSHLFCQTSNKPQTPGSCKGVLHEHATVKIFSLRKPNLFPRTNTKSHFNPYSSAIKTPSSMLPNIDIL
jgi:hypothetical protein